MELLADILRRLAPTLDLEQAPQETHEQLNQRRNATWRTACAEGRCRYAADPVHPDQEPPWVDSTTTCGGYVGFRYVKADDDPFKWIDAPDETDPQKLVWRWGLCGRHVQWGVKLAALRAKSREAFTKRSRKGAHEPTTAAWKKDQGSE